MPKIWRFNIEYCGTGKVFKNCNLTENVSEFCVGRACDALPYILSYSLFWNLKIILVIFVSKHLNNVKVFSVKSPNFRHSNKRNNCQHCLRSSQEAMHYVTVIPAKLLGRRFHKANFVVVPCKLGATLRCVLLYDNVASVCMGLKVWPVSNYTQQVPALLWFHANAWRNMPGPTILRVVGQQCCVRLHGPLGFQLPQEPWEGSIVI